MYAIQMLNSNNEWELCRWVFDSAEEADQFAADELAVFEEYTIVELEKY